MALPKPSVPLTDVCAVMFNNTLYTYSNNAFQSLPLEQGAQWTQLPQGEQVTGAVCVGSTPGDPSLAGFYVIGGKSQNSTYLGLQKFTYSTGKWEALKPGAPVTQDRLWHGAVYLNGSDSILMYAGAQDGSQSLSTTTFTIGASAPYTVTSYQSVAPPTINPILLPWSATQAVLIGGSDWNSKVMLFSPSTAWIDSGASLAEPIQKNTSEVQAVLVTGDDGCKSLYTFDMTRSPNEVNRTLLLNGSGAPVQDSAAIASRWLGGAVEEESPVERSDLESRALTQDDWPAYNATDAPTSTRNGYAVAQDPNGLVVITGGNADDVLCVFNGKANGWEDASAMLGEKAVVSSSASSTASSTTVAQTATSAPPSAAASTTAASSDSSSTTIGGLSSNAILGIGLGAILGFAFILTAIYCLVRRHRKKSAFIEAGHVRRSSGIASDEKDGQGFASDSLPRGAQNMGASTFRGHNSQDSQNSFSSMAILMGKNNSHQKSSSQQLRPPSPQTRQYPQGARRTPTPDRKRLSSDSMFKEQFKSTISKPILLTSTTQQARQAGPVAGGARDDKGVSFAANAAAAGQSRPRGPPPAPASGPSDRQPQDGPRRSSGWNRYWSGGSTLNILGYGNGGNNSAKRTTVASDQSSHYSDTQNRMTQDSATVPPLNVVEGRASFNRVNSGSPTVAQYAKHIKEAVPVQIERPPSRASSSGYSSGIPASVHDTWDPTSANRPWGADRAPSSVYASSYATPLVAPTAGGSSSSSSRAPQLPPLLHHQVSPPSSRPPTGVSQQPQLAKASVSSDMSWLNLGDRSKR